MITSSPNSFFMHRQACPVCKSTQCFIRYKVPFDSPVLLDLLSKAYNNRIEPFHLANIPLSILQCLDCDLIYQEFVPNQSLSSLLYSEGISLEDTKIRHLRKPLSSFLWYAQELASIITLLKKSPFEIKILDFGMGWGQWASMASSFGCQVYGFEPSLKQAEYAQRNGVNVITSYSEISNHKFDFINTEQVLEHLDVPFDIASYLTSTLNKSGIIKFSVPFAVGINKRFQIMDWSIPQYQTNNLDFIYPLEHINYFHGRSMRTLLKLLDLNRVYIPIHVQYLSSIWLRGGTKNKHLLKNILFPLWRNIFNKGNYILAQNP